MKPLWQLVFYCLMVCTVTAQPAQQERLLSPFIATDTGFCWLVTIKNKTASALTNQYGVQVLRQLSGADFIIKGNPSLIPKSAVLRAFPANDNWKLSRRLLSEFVQMHAADTINCYIMADSIAAIKKILVLARALVLYENNNTLQLKTTFGFIKKVLLPDERIYFIDFASRHAKEEMNISGFDYTLNQINTLHNVYPASNGKNIVVSVKENRPDTADIDFTARFLETNSSATTLSTHATAMATIIAGGGNSFYTAKGVAWGATISSSPFDILLPDNDSFYLRYHISVQNHSYGTGIENFYGADAAAYDGTAYNNASLTQVFSCGNSGNQASTIGQYSGIDGFANLTGSFKMAKKYYYGGFSRFLCRGTGT